MENSIEIRYLQQADRDSWKVLFYQYFICCKIDPKIVEIDVAWQRMMDNNFPIFGVGAFINNELSGIGHFVIHASTWTDKPYFYLEDLFIEENSRKMGVGSKIFAFIQEVAKHNGGGCLYCTTKESNKIAQEFYSKVAKKSDIIQYDIKITD